MIFHLVQLTRDGISLAYTYTLGRAAYWSLSHAEVAIMCRNLMPGRTRPGKANLCSPLTLASVMVQIFLGFFVRSFSSQHFHVLDCTTTPEPLDETKLSNPKVNLAQVNDHTVGKVSSVFCPSGVAEFGNIILKKS